MKKVSGVLGIGSFFLLAAVLFVIGSYLDSKPVWFSKSDQSYYNQGVRQYQADDFQEASDSFGRAIFETDDQRIKSLSFYNLGTMAGQRALAEGVDPRTSLELVAQAINKLTEAIKIDPTNDEAKYNLEFLIKKKVEILQKNWEEIQKSGGGHFPFFPPPGYSPGSGGTGY